MTNPVAAQVQRLTGTTPEQYAQAIWDGALAYCQWYCYGEEFSVDSLMITRSFWRWWRGVWSHLDMNFILEYGDYENLGETEFLKSQWLQMHEPETIISQPTSDIVVECCKIMKSNYKKHDSK